MFAHYPSAMLNGQSRLHRDAAEGVGPRALRELSMWRFAQGWLADAALVETAWQALPAQGENAVTLDQWALALKMDAIQAQRLAAWMAKVGLVAVR
jgi:hypothetical protein